nr:MAG TPA: hypothetical protein [Caudoviricetes sp.]
MILSRLPGRLSYQLHFSTARRFVLNQNLLVVKRFLV